MQNPIGEKAMGLAMQIRERFWEVGVMQYRPGHAGGRHGGDSVEQGESRGLRAQG